MKLFITYCLLLSWIFVQAGSAGELSGKLVNAETKKSLGGIRIVLENKMDRYEVSTEPNGIFYFMHIPNGRYTMSITSDSHEFKIEKVKIYDSYNSWLTIPIPEVPELPKLVNLVLAEPVINPIEPNNDRPFTQNTQRGGTESLNNFLSMQPGVDVVQGKINIRGSDQVKIFIDGAPVLGRPTFNDSW